MARPSVFILINAHTAAVILCGKIIKIIAKERGAEPNNTVIHYVTYLYTNNNLPKDCKDWVDHISTLNIEPEEITTMDKDDATDLVTFTELILRIIYESNLRLKKRYKKDISD